MLEGTQLQVFESLIPFLLIEDDGDGGGEIITPQPADAPPTPPVRGDGGWGRGPFNPVGFGPGKWFSEFYNTVKQLIVSNNILKRMKELHISDNGQKRVKKAAKQAAINVNSLLANPRATAYKIPQWTFDSPKTPVIKRWNEGFTHEFKLELSKLNEQQILN